MKYIVIIFLLVGCNAHKTKIGFYRSVNDHNFYSGRFTIVDTGVAVGEIYNNVLNIKEGDTFTFQRGKYAISFYRLPDSLALPTHKIRTSYKGWWIESNIDENPIKKIDSNGFVTFF